MRLLMRMLMRMNNNKGLLNRGLSLLQLTAATCRGSDAQRREAAKKIQRIVRGMPVFSKGSRFHDSSTSSHRAWTVLRKVGEGQSAEVYSVRCEEIPSTQVWHLESA